MALFPTVFLVGLADESFLVAALAQVEERRLRQKAGNLPGEGNVAMMAVLSDESSITPWIHVVFHCFVPITQHMLFSLLNWPDPRGR